MKAEKIPQQIIILLLLGAGALIGWREWTVRPDGDVSVHVLDVGQGDGIFITGPSGQQILIDGGPNLDALAGMGKRMSFFDRSIDLLILSHPDNDHVFALPDVLERYNVQTVLLTGVVHDNSRYEEMLDIIERKKIPVIVADPAKDIDLGDGLRLDVLWPQPVFFQKDAEGASNDTSIVLRLTYGEDSVLFTGDMEKDAEDAVLAAGMNMDADVLKVAHHGSRTSTSTGFLLAVSPTLAVISVSAENSYGHPHPHVINRLRHYSIPIRVTAWEGTITLDLDGKEGVETARSPRN